MGGLNKFGDYLASSGQYQNRGLFQNDLFSGHMNQDVNAAATAQTNTLLGAPPDAPDLTDQLLQKTRTNFAMRLMTGKNQNSMFGNTQTGGLNLGGNVLGGS
jgi:hypothetical protein